VKVEAYLCKAIAFTLLDSRLIWQPPYHPAPMHFHLSHTFLLFQPFLFQLNVFKHPFSVQIAKLTKKFNFFIEKIIKI